MRPLVLPEPASVLIQVARTRWRPVLPLAFPHATTKADVYDEYDIPRGAIVFGNIGYGSTSSFEQVLCDLKPWSHSALVMDPNLFDDPETFDPTRFLTPHKPAGNWDGKVESDFTMPFGFGRRVCPGMHIALQSLFISLAR